MYVSVQRAALRLGVSPVTIRRWTASGFLPCTRTPGGHRRISTDDLDDLAARMAEGDQLAARMARERELETVLDTALALGSRLALPELLAEISRRATGVLGSDYCTIYELDTGADLIRTIVDYDRSGRRWPPQGPYRLADYPLTRRVLEDQVVGQVDRDDPAADPAEVATLHMENDAHMLLVPLVYQGRSIGLLETVRHEKGRRRTRQELRMARAIADQAAVAIVNARTFATIRRAERDLVAVRKVLATLRRGLPAIAAAASTPLFLDTVAETVCAAFGAVSCAAAAGGRSATATGTARSPADPLKAAVAAAHAPPPGDLAITVTFARPQSTAVREALDLVAALAAVCGAGAGTGEEAFKAVPGAATPPASTARPS